jgi:tRNA (uracil-5-)-methyltransferase TRM9
MPDMDQTTIKQLLEVNRQFYQTFALQFSSTRQRLQPGVQRILSQVPPHAHMLDLGCGHGEAWPFLAAHGFQGTYVGLDSNEALLAIARNRAVELDAAGLISPTYLQADLASPEWARALGGSHPGLFDLISAFSCLHHIPGELLRLQLLNKINELLSPGGRFVHSEWQLLNSPRLRARLQPWEAAGLRVEQVDPGDCLIDWRQGGVGLRYIHCFSEAELSDLASQAGFTVIEGFYSDGEGGRLGLYQVWETYQ